MVEAIEDVIIQGIRPQLKNSGLLTLYTRSGSYIGVERDSSAWTTIIDSQHQIVGTQRVSFPLSFADIHVSAGSIQAFYIATTE